jgi:hypothetical protein
MKAFLQQHGTTIFFVAILFMLLAPYLGIRYGRSPEPTAPPHHIDPRKNEAAGAGLPIRPRSPAPPYPSSPKDPGQPEESQSSRTLGELEALVTK